MEFQITLRKMQTEYTDSVQYFMDAQDRFIHVNQLLGKELQVSLERFQCLSCGKDKKIFRQGYCYDCFYKTPLTGDWVMRPELSKAHLDIEDRDLEYEKSVQLEPHIVYLANSSSVKVGVTRKRQIPTRWIDQGAHEALEILEVPNRYLAGIAEVALKEHVADKTNWRKMLTNNIQDEDLIDWRNRLKNYLPESVKAYFLENQTETHIRFPVQTYPTKVKSLNLEKTPEFSGKLTGIKGQYLIFENGTVFNVRNHEGFVVKLVI